MCVSVVHQWYGRSVGTGLASRRIGKNTTRGRCRGGLGIVVIARPRCSVCFNGRNKLVGQVAAAAKNLPGFFKSITLVCFFCVAGNGQL